tara:strand:- start:10267 stop:11217 length:951 start_codon:yes stop_codon:yes gene_type:complete
LEELTLLYFLRIFSLTSLIIVSYLSYFFYFKDISLENDLIYIKKNQDLNITINNNFRELNLFEKKILKSSIAVYSKYFKNIHYGKFVVSNETNIYNILKKITKPSNYIDKLTIVEGWSQNQLNNMLMKKFNDFNQLSYFDVIADTYYLHSYENFRDFSFKIINFKNNFLKKYENNQLLDKFSWDEIFIIGSLLEKEGINYDDKRKIFSVIINRLEKKMRLEIDATVIYALTDGDYELNRKLTYNDLKIIHPYNTYKIRGLPPKPISYVGTKTIELIFENYKSDFLFYFFNNDINQHVYSKTFKEHKQKLNEYRNKK